MLTAPVPTRKLSIVRTFVSRDDARVGIAVLILAATMTAAVVATGAVRDLNSDDLVWQRLLHIWGSTGHAQGWISEDVFPTRFGLYAALDGVGLNGRSGVVAASIILNLVGAASFLVALIFSGSLTKPRRWGVVVGAGLLASWSTIAWADVFFSPNTRPLEIGLALLAVAWLGVRTANTRRKGPQVLTAAVLAVLWFSDPLVFLIIAIPAALVTVIDARRVEKRRRAVTVLGVLALSAVGAAALRGIAALFDLSTESVARGGYFLTPITDLPQRAVTVFERSAALLGVAGSDLTSGGVVDLLIAWLRLGVVGLAAIGVVVIARSWSDTSLLARTLVVALAVTPLAVVFINIYPNPEFVIDRYLVMVLVAISGLAIIALSQISSRRSAVAAAAIAVLVGAVFITNINTWRDNRHIVRDANAIALGDAVKFQNWDRIYAGYWMAVRQAELASGDSQWASVVCDRSGPLELMDWNNDSSLLRPRVKSIAVSVERQYCDFVDIVRRYGPPTERVTLEGHDFVVYRGAAVVPALRDLRP